MRIDVVKYLLMGPVSRKDRFFAALQEEGIVECIGDKNHIRSKDEQVDTIVEALHILRRRAPVSAIASSTDVRAASAIAREVIDTSKELDRLHEEGKVLGKAIDRIEVFGDFSLTDICELEERLHRKVQFFVAKKGVEVEERSELFFVGMRHELRYFMAINGEPTSYPGLIEMVIDTSLPDLQEELSALMRARDTLETMLDTLSHQKGLLQEGLLAELNRFHLEDSKGKVALYIDERVFCIQGWVPENKEKQLIALAKRHDVIAEPIVEVPEDKKPTYLENKRAARLGEDLVSIYDTPSNQDRDPSLWVYSAFALFFSMIIGDAGYGLLLLAISLYLWHKFRAKKGAIRRVILLSTSLSIGCIIWGILTASFFGIPLKPESPLRTLSVIDTMAEKKAEYLLKHHGPTYDELIKENPPLKEITDSHALFWWPKSKEGGEISYPVHDKFADNALIELVIFIGTIHLMLSFARYLDRNHAAIGWIIAMAGGYLFFPSLLHATSLIHYIFAIPPEGGALVGKYMLYGGIALASILAIIQRRLAGLPEVMQVIQIFADVMSYLRIYALALAGMIMAATFNSISTKVPLILGIFIIIAGHTVNFVLALMGGIIHGLRLNFIEWYHYSFEGGGKKFNPLALLKKE